MRELVTVMLLGNVTVCRKGRILSRVVFYRDRMKWELSACFSLEGYEWFENGVYIFWMSCF